MSAGLRRHRWVREQLFDRRQDQPRAYEVGRRYLSSSWRYGGADLRADLVAAALSDRSAAAAWLALVALSQSPDVEAPALLDEILQAAPLPEEMRAYEALMMGRWRVLRGDARGCAILEKLQASAKSGAEGLAATAESLYLRCADAGLYLDAARKAVE